MRACVRSDARAGGGYENADRDDFGEQQRARYRDRNVVERCFNKLTQWCGIAMRSDKTARNYHAGLCLAAILHWVGTLTT